MSKEPLADGLRVDVAAATDVRICVVDVHILEPLTKPGRPMNSARKSWNIGPHTEPLRPFPRPRALGKHSCEVAHEFFELATCVLHRHHQADMLREILIGAAGVGRRHSVGDAG